MDEQAVDHAADADGVALVEGAEGKDDEHHDEVNAGAKAEAADERVLRHELQLAAERVVEGGEDERDEDVEQDAQGVVACASLQGLFSDEAVGNDEDDVMTKEDAGLSMEFKVR
jgi:hypothetical protein